MGEMVDLAKTPEEIKKDSMGYALPGGSEPEMPIYPWGTSLCLCDDVIDKLEADGEGDFAEVGDLVHIHAIGEVTSVSKNATTDGVKRRIEIQLTHMAIEDEDLENDEVDEEMDEYEHKTGRDSLYR